MTTDNWQQFKELFQSVLDIPPEQRSAYLRRVCREPSSRAEVEALLLCYERVPEDGKNAVGHPDKAKAGHDDPLIESFIDHYQIVEKLGQRGPATQYLALRINDPGLKQVVITIVNTATNAGEFLRSFKQNRLILTNLRHPNIASFLETGITPSGLPYFVTDYIEGAPVDEYCDAKRLTTHDRIKLFMDICDPVQYAHQHLIAHSGINARSILVTNEGVPKLLDLGIAGIVNHELRAQIGLGALKSGELECISPEEFRGEPTTTGADVYGLGVLLYQLLTGHSPYRMKTGKEDDLLPAIFEANKPSKVLNQVVEEPAQDGNKITINPQYLSRCRNEELRAVRKFLAGDLDSIVLKAIQKDASKRYASVEQFLGDLQRHLEGRPVSARDNTFLYRARKFIQRHKALVIAAPCLMTAVITAMAMMIERLASR